MAKSRSKLNCIFYPISPLASQDKHIYALELKRVLPYLFPNQVAEGPVYSSVLAFPGSPSLHKWHGSKEPFEVLLPASPAG